MTRQNSKSLPYYIYIYISNLEYITLKIIFLTLRLYWDDYIEAIIEKRRDMALIFSSKVREYCVEFL